MSADYQTLNKFIKSQVKQIEAPFKLDDTLLEICQESQELAKRNDSRGLKARDLSKILKNVNVILNNGYHRFYSSQAIAQITEQIMNLRHEEHLDRLEFIDLFKDLELPLDLKSDYKIYSLSQIIEQVVNLPEMKTDGGDNEVIIAEKVVYKERRKELLAKIERIQLLKEKTKLIRNYRQLIKTKVGERANVQQNLPTTKNNELSLEINKLRVNLERFNNMDKQQKSRLKEILYGGDE